MSKKNKAAAAKRPVVGESGIYDARTLGTPKMLLLGLQHMFAMFGATILVPMLTGLDVSTTLLFAGLGTLLFHLITKWKVPAFLGSSFAFLGGYAAVAPMIDGAPNKEMLPYACFGVACAGLLYLLLAFLIKVFGSAKVMRYFPPIVTGPIIIGIGLTLSQSAIDNCASDWLIALVAILLVVIVVNSVCQFLSMYHLQWVGQRVVMDLREAIFAHLQRLSVSFYNSQRAGDMISRTVADTQLLQTTVSNVITDAIRQPLTLVMVLVFVVVIEWKLALFALVLVPTVVVPIVLIGRRLRRISREGQKRLAELTSIMKESLDGVAVVKAFGQEERMQGQFDRLCHGFFRQMIRATKAKCLNDPITHIVGKFFSASLRRQAQSSALSLTLHDSRPPSRLKYLASNLFLRVLFL